MTPLGVEITEHVRVYPRTDGRFVIFDKRLPLGTNAGVFARADKAESEARRRYGGEIKPRAAKHSANDEEAFALMKIAIANGFARHEPAYTVAELETMGHK